MLPLRINLAQGGLERGHDILMDISDPESPRYSDHLTAEEVAELVSALPFLAGVVADPDRRWRLSRVFTRPSFPAPPCSLSQLYRYLIMPLFLLWITVRTS